MTQVNTDRSKELGAKSTNFIPLSDLLKRNLYAEIAVPLK